MVCISYIHPQLSDVLFSSTLTPAIKGKNVPFLQGLLYCSCNKAKVTFRLACILNTSSELQLRKAQCGLQVLSEKPD